MEKLLLFYADEETERKIRNVASLLLLCGLREKRLDKLLFELRREEAVVEYKAVLTPVNRTWTLRHLYLEMQREKAAISRKS